MSNSEIFLWLIPGLPLLAAVVTALFGPKLLGRQSHWPCILATICSCVLAVSVLIDLASQDAPTRPHTHDLVYENPEPGEIVVPQVAVSYPWLCAGVPGTKTSMQVNFGLRADGLTSTMTVMITFVGSLIAIFACGYMHGDPGYPRFFACVSLFVFSMLTLVLADNLILLYAGWEGVGLCSYLLIGFWFTKPAAADAARKAFLVTRIGDVGLFLGILLLWVSFGYHLDYASIFREVDSLYKKGGLDQGLLFTACLLLFCGAAGKSAQFPLHVWLPDAMEGPTPVSALIHAATMVTAGVYLVARFTPLFMLSTRAQLVVGSIGAFTALFAALIALTQTDLKRVLAYSTLSQLGYMFLALGCATADTALGKTNLVTFAVLAAVFHLITHAFFKALLFLSAGSVMHSMGNVIDMRRFSGLRKVLPYTHWTFLCGALALAGFPLFAGFWSKDEILDAAFNAGQQSVQGTFYFVWFGAGLFTAFLTAFYTFRAYFMTFWGELKVPPEAGSHGHGDHGDAHAGHGHEPTHAHHAAESAHAGPGQAHESPAVMTIPLMILAVFAIGIGAVLGPLTGWFEHFVSHTNGLPAVPHGDGGEMNYTLMAISSLVALAGIGLAYVMYIVKPEMPRSLAQAFPGLYQLSLNKFHIDELYEVVLLKPLAGFTQFTRIFDLYVIDALVDLLAQIPRLIGFLFRPIQNGLLQFYALAMVLGLTVFLLALVRSL